jgi:hypothetical protein
MRKMAFFGNSVGWEVFALDLTSDPMRVKRVVRTALGPYPVDEAAADTLFAITRGSPSVTAIDIPTLTPLGDIPLSHKPRSASRHPTRGLVVVSGADRPRTSVVDVTARRVRLTVGVDHGGPVSGFGGSLASGHERWLPDQSAAAAPRFFVLDRVNRTVAVFRYDPPTGTKLFEAATPSPVHHLLADEPSRTWYALCEGRPADGVPPSILPVRETATDTFEVGTAFELPVPKGSVAASGGHHLDAKGGRLFAGSNEGNLYVFDKTPLGANPVVLPTGPGCGHTRFTRFDGLDVAVTVNHTAPHVSVVDVSTPGREAKLADIPVSVALPAGPDDKTQGHTTAVFADAPHLLYVMASLDATLREVDLRARLVRRSVRLVQLAGSLPPVPLQGHFGEYTPL